MHLLRSLEDSERIHESASKEKHAVIVGGGYIGLEVAASLRSMGLRVLLIEAAPRILERVTSPDISNFFKTLHEEKGVTIRCGKTLSEIQGRESVEAIEMVGGETFPASFLIIGAGLSPSTDLALKAGLKVDNGITTDIYGQTSDPSIYAAGDCASHPSALYGRRLRLESVQNALGQAASVAASLCGKKKPYQEAPWFWSDQYDIKWQMAGLSEGYDEAIKRRGAKSAKGFSLFYLKEGRLIAVDSINAPADFMAVRRALDASFDALPDARLKVDKELLSKSALSIKEILLPAPRP